VSKGINSFLIYDCEGTEKVCDIQIEVKKLSENAAWKMKNATAF